MMTTIFLGKIEALTIYNNSLKLFVCGENILYHRKSDIKQFVDFSPPDFAIWCNRVDHVKGIHYPFAFYSRFYHHFLKQIPKVISKSEDKKSFCAFIVSNPTDSVGRKEFFTLLSEYKQVHSYGKVHHNRDFPDHYDDHGKHSTAQKIYCEYKFVICFENSSAENYITEKIIFARSAGAIPIYRGAPNVGEYFNTDAIINYDDYGSFEAMMAKVMELDQDDEKYDAFQRQPFFKDPDLIQSMDKAMVMFLDEIYAEIERRRSTPQSWWRIVWQEVRFIFFYFKFNAFEMGKRWLRKIQF